MNSVFCMAIRVPVALRVLWTGHPPRVERITTTKTTHRFLRDGSFRCIVLHTSNRGSPTRSAIGEACLAVYWLHSPRASRRHCTCFAPNCFVFSCKALPVSYFILLITFYAQIPDISPFCTASKEISHHICWTPNSVQYINQTSSVSLLQYNGVFHFHSC
jgi:hypothetical protein